MPSEEGPAFFRFFFLPFLNQMSERQQKHQCVRRVGFLLASAIKCNIQKVKDKCELHDEHIYTHLGADRSY